MNKLISSIVAGLAMVLVSAPASAQSATPPPAERGSDRLPQSELAEARRALAEAARRVAELSASEADRVIRQIDFERVEMPRVRIGIIVADGDTHREGVQVGSVSEGGPAAGAGLAAGDLLIELNGHSLAPGTERVQPPVRRIRDALAEAEPGQVVQAKYRRGRQTREVQLTLEAAEHTPMAFSFGYGEGPRRLVQIPGLADMPPIPMTPMPRALGDYEFVRITEALGRYFEADKGLLVVRVGEHNPMNLEEGDVVLTIGGREPQSTLQVARILRSYEPGDKVMVEIIRQKRRQSIEVTIPVQQRLSWMEMQPTFGW